MTQSTGPRSPEQAILMMRIIGISLGTGVTLFAIVSWFLHSQQGPITTDIDPALAFNGFLALFLIAGVGAVLFWRGRVAPILDRPRTHTEWQPRAASIQTGLIITWALIEGAALAGEVVYFLTGSTMAGILGVVLIWGGVGLTWPRREWI